MKEINPIHRYQFESFKELVDFLVAQDLFATKGEGKELEKYNINTKLLTKGQLDISIEVGCSTGKYISFSFNKSFIHEDKRIQIVNDSEEDNEEYELSKLEQSLPYMGYKITDFVLLVKTIEPVLPKYIPDALAWYAPIGWLRCKDLNFIEAENCYMPPSYPVVKYKDVIPYENWMEEYIGTKKDIYVDDRFTWKSNFKDV